MVAGLPVIGGLANPAIGAATDIYGKTGMAMSTQPYREGTVAQRINL